MYEIERKFLLNRPAAEIILEARTAGHLVENLQIEQRYLEDAGEWTLRCRRTSTRNRVKCSLSMKRRISNERHFELESTVGATLARKGGWKGKRMSGRVA